MKASTRAYVQRIGKTLWEFLVGSKHKNNLFLKDNYNKK